MSKKIIYILIIISHAIASNFSIYNQIDNTTAVSFNIGEYSIESINNFDRIISNSKGGIEEYGSPELPLFSFNYGIEIRNIVLHMMS